MNRSRSQTLFTDLYPQDILNYEENAQIQEINQFYSNLYQKSYGDTGSSRRPSRRIQNHRQLNFIKKVVVSDFSHTLNNERDLVLDINSVECDVDINRCQQDHRRNKMHNKYEKFLKIKRLLKGSQDYSNKIRRHKSFQALRIAGYPEQSTQQSEFRQQKANQTCRQAANVKTKLQSLQNNVKVLRSQNRQYGRKMKEYQINLQILKQQIQYIKQGERLASRSRSRLAESSKINEDLMEEFEQTLKQESQSRINVTKQRDQLLSQLNQTLFNHEHQILQLKESLSKLLDQNVKAKQKQCEYIQSLQKLKKDLIDIKQQNFSLRQRNQVLQQQIFESQQSLQVLQNQNTKTQQENHLLNEESIQLAQTIQSIRQEYEHAQRLNSQFEQIIKQKQAQIQQLKRKADQIHLKLQQAEDQTEFLRKVIVNDETTIRQQEDAINKNNQEIKRLSRQLQQGDRSSTCLFVQKLKELLKLPTSDQQHLLIVISNLVQHSNRLQHFLEGYFEISQLFGISPRIPSCHQRLISEICRYKNNMSVLIRKYNISESRLAALTRQNQQLAYCLQSNQQTYMNHSSNLQSLIQSQNQELIRNKAQQLSQRMKKKYTYY